MTPRQKILQVFYPLLMFYSKLRKRTKVLQNKKNIQPAESFYDFSVELNNGKQLELNSLKGKKILIVNTASDCGYTNQYDDLQKLADKYNDKLIVIGFPANDFKQQEKGSDEEIAAFCKLNYGVQFPLAKKSSVVRGLQQNKIFAWLSDKRRNGWNNKQPPWNFSKYLIDPHGRLSHYFDPAIPPLSNEILSAIEQ